MKVITLKTAKAVSIMWCQQTRSHIRAAFGWLPVESQQHLCSHLDFWMSNQLFVVSLIRQIETKSRPYDYFHYL